MRGLVAGLRAWLPESAHAWYWLANPGAVAPAGAAELRSTFTSGPSWHAKAGFDVCTVHAIGVDGDARSLERLDMPEGTTP